MNFIENATRNKIQLAAKAGNIWVNDIPVKSNYKVKPKDVVRVVLAHPPHENLLVAEDIPLDIVYEDQELMVVNKPAGMVVHPGHGNYQGTLVNGLIHHVENLPNNSNERPGLVHRIDKDTSGLLVVAKTEFAMAHLANQFFEKTTDRLYHAGLGNVEQDRGTVEGHIGRNLKSSTDECLSGWNWKACCNTLSRIGALRLCHFGGMSIRDGTTHQTVPT